MATTTSITSSYVGTFASKYVSAALLSANTINNGYVTVLPNVKYKTTLPKIATDAILKDASCDFSATSTVTLTERILTVEDFQVNLQLCKKDFHSTFLGEQQGASAHDTLPTSFADYLVGHVAAKVAAKIETNIWSGANANSGEFDGFEVLLAADANLPSANEVSGTTVTALNVITELGKIVDAVPAACYGKEGLAIYAAKNIVKAYVRALGGFTALSGTAGNVAPGTGVSNQSTMWYSNGALSFDGIPVYMVEGMSSNKAICTYKDNLFFGCGLLSDENEVKVIDMADLDGSQNVRIIMRMSMGIQYGIVEDIVTYGITNNAN